jgi:hypothetical protein
MEKSKKKQAEKEMANRSVLTSNSGDTVAYPHLPFAACECLATATEGY